MSDRLSSWKELIVEEMAQHGETWKDLVANTMTFQQSNVQFDAGYGSTKGQPFTAWSATRVYFPVCHEGSEWCGSAPRHPNGQATEHQGV